MTDAWERPPEYDDPPDDCLGCGVCMACVNRSILADRSWCPECEQNEMETKGSLGNYWCANCGTTTNPAGHVSGVPKMSSTVCATCRRVIKDGYRSVCFSCYPEGASIGASRAHDVHGVEWWMKVAEAKQEERDKALVRVAELEKALRYAAECSTLEMVKDTARGMGLVE